MATYASIDITGLFDDIGLSSGNQTFSSIDLTGQFDEINLSSGNQSFQSIDLTGQFDDINLSSQESQPTKLLPVFLASSIADPTTILFDEGASEPAMPLANFSYTRVPPLMVNFLNTSLGVITGSYWIFGDNNTGTETSPTHVYAVLGDKTVILQVFTGPYFSYCLKIVSVGARRRQTLITVF